MLKFYTDSDAGAVKVGIIGQFTINIPNLYGDCTTEVIVLEENEELPDRAKWVVSVAGEQINIYAYDCGGERGEEIVTTLSGNYRCYNLEKNHNGVVIFQKY